MAYVEASTLSRNRVRLLVGDISTSTSGEFLHDGAYDFFVANTPNIYSAACLAANTLAAVNGGKAITKTVGDLSYTKGDANYYKTLCEQFKLMSTLQSSAAPYAGGISIADKRAYENDTDRTQPSFFREMFDDRAARDPDVTTQEDSTG